MNVITSQPVCVECGYIQEQLYIEYGKGNIKLIQCVLEPVADLSLETLWKVCRQVPRE